MVELVAKRLLALAVQLMAVVLGIFALLRILPTDPVAKYVGLFATHSAYVHTKHALGLDRSFLSQLALYVQHLFELNFGKSWATSTDVSSEIVARLPVTVQLVALGFGLALLIAVPLGFLSAARPGGMLDRVVSVYALFAGAQPDFWWGLLFVFVFFFKLGWAPAPLGVVGISQAAPNGPTHFVLLDSLLSGNIAVFRTALAHFALPVITFAFVNVGWLLKMVRQSTMDVLRSEFVLYARAVGYSRRPFFQLILTNALAPLLTVSGILVAFSLGGTVLIETVFSLNGMGVYALNSTLNVDFPAIQGAVIVLTFCSLVIYVAMDLLHASVDPRVRRGAVR